MDRLTDRKTADKIREIVKALQAKGIKPSDRDLRYLKLADYEEKESRGSYQCFHCLSWGVIWDNDFDFEDFGYEGQGIVHVCHCTNCGAEIEYQVREDDDDE